MGGLTEKIEHQVELVRRQIMKVPASRQCRIDTPGMFGISNELRLARLPHFYLHGTHIAYLFTVQQILYK